MAFQSLWCVLVTGFDVATSPRGERTEENRNGHHQREEASQQINEGLWIKYIVIVASIPKNVSINSSRMTALSPGRFNKRYWCCRAGNVLVLVIWQIKHDIGHNIIEITKILYSANTKWEPFHENLMLPKLTTVPYANQYWLLQLHCTMSTRELE